MDFHIIAKKFKTRLKKFKKLPKGFGSITEVKKPVLNRFYVRIPMQLINGKMKRKYLGYYPTYDIAFEKLLEYHYLNLSLEFIEEFTFGNLSINYLNDIEKRYNRNNYLFIKKIVYDYFSDLFNKEMRNIKYYTLQNKINQMYKGESKKAIIFLRYIFNESMKLEIVNKNISLLLVPSDKNKYTINRRLYSKKDIENIINIDYTILVYSNILKILLYTGARISEVLEIESDNIYLDDRYILAGKKTKNGKNRIIPIHKEIYNIIKVYYLKAKKDNSKYIFTIKGKNISMNMMNYHFKKIMKELNIDNNIHSIRHTFVSRAKDLDLNESKIKKIIGHKTNDITDSIYTHYTHDSLIKLIDKFYY